MNRAKIDIISLYIMCLRAFYRDSLLNPKEVEQTA